MTDDGFRLPDRTRLGPVRLQVADLARSEAFYTDVLGLARREGGGGSATMGATDGEEALVELVERRGVARHVPGSRLGLFHYALLVPDRPSLAAFLRHAAERGVRLGLADHEVSEALYLSDPDGLGIEVYADRPRSAWRSRDGQWIMSTDPLDVDDLLAQGTTGPFRGLPAGTAVGHVHLHVAGLAPGARFYHGALGFDEVVKDYPGALFLSAGGYHHHVGTNVWAAGAMPPRDDDARLLSWTLVLPSVDDVDRVARNAAAHGHPAAARGAHGGVVLTDPWGTDVEVLAAGVAQP